MPRLADWPEVESKVHCPGGWLSYSVGALFLVFGVAGLLTGGPNVPPGAPPWIGKAFLDCFAFLGGLGLAAAVYRSLSTGHIQHAPLDVLPNVPAEPLVREGSVVLGRIVHELLEEPDGWQFRPAPRRWRNERTWLFGFGIPS